MSRIKFANNRESGIELLKIIAMFCIVLFHCIMTAGRDSFVNEGITYQIATPVMEGQLLEVMYYLGTIGNIIFFISSCWFFIDNNNIKSNKVMNIIMDCTVVAIILMLIFKLLGTNISKGDMLASCFPTLFCLNWYVVAYLIMYLIHPLLNKIMDSISKKQMLLYVVIFVVIYGIEQLIKKNTYFYTDLIGFIGIYIIVGYAKRYLRNIVDNIKINGIILVVTWLLVLGMQLAVNIVGIYVGVVSNKILHLDYICNPIIILMCFSLFNIFRSLKFKNGFINYISSLTLLIYIVHENYIFREYLREGLMYKAWCMLGKINIVVFLICFAILLFIVATLISCIYNLFIQPLVHKLGDVILEIIQGVYSKVEDIILNLN